MQRGHGAHPECQDDEILRVLPGVHVERDEACMCRTGVSLQARRACWKARQDSGSYAPTRGRMAQVSWKARLCVTKPLTGGAARMVPATSAVRTSCADMMPYTCDRSRVRCRDSTLLPDAVLTHAARSFSMVPEACRGSYLLDEAPTQHVVCLRHPRHKRYVLQGFRVSICGMLLVLHNRSEHLRWRVRQEPST